MLPEINRAVSRRKQRLAVSVFFFAMGFTFATWASRIPHIQAKLNLSEAALGTVLMALPLGLMVSLLMAGQIIGRSGSKKVMFLAAISYFGILFFLGLAENSWQLAFVLFLFGLAGNFFNISVNAQAVHVEKMYGRSIMASFHGIWSLAGFSGAAAGLVMISLKWLPWQHFALAALVALTGAVLFIGNTAETRGEKQASGFALPDKNIIRLGMMAFGCLVCEGTMFDWSGLYFAKVVKAPDSLTSLGYAVFMGCMALGRFFADKMVTALGPRTMLKLSGVFITCGLLISVLFPTVPAATTGFMLVGFGVSSVVPIVYSLAGKSSTMGTGQALAAVSTVGFAGFLAGPPLIGYMAQVTSLRWSFLLVAFIGLSTTILAGVLPKPGRNT